MSMLTKIIRMQQELQFTEALEAFIVKWGAPNVLLSDNTQVEISLLWRQYFRHITSIKKQPNHNTLIRIWLNGTSKYEKTWLISYWKEPEALWSYGYCVYIMCHTYWTNWPTRNLIGAHLFKWLLEWLWTSGHLCVSAGTRASFITKKTAHSQIYVNLRADLLVLWKV